jgi:hypothetical protein
MPKFLGGPLDGLEVDDPDQLLRPAIAMKFREDFERLALYQQSEYEYWFFVKTFAAVDLFEVSAQVLGQSEP